MVEFSITGTLALGMFMILLTGQIDLAAGSGVGLVGGIAAVLVFQQGWPAPAALLAGVAAALGLWIVDGALIEAANSSFHHHAGWTAGVQRPVLAYDPEYYRAGGAG
jgi:ABC-type xylose transport system permease subunit